MSISDKGSNTGPVLVVADGVAIRLVVVEGATLAEESIAGLVTIPLLPVLAMVGEVVIELVVVEALAKESDTDLVTVAVVSLLEVTGLTRHQWHES